MLKLSPCSYSHLHTGQLINISHLLSLHWLDYVGGVFFFFFLEIQKTGAQLNSWQAGIDIRAAQLFTPAARCCCCLSHNQRSSQRLQSRMNTFLIPSPEHWACFVQTLVPHWSGCASGSEQCPSSLPFIPVTLSQDSASLSNDGAATLHFTAALPLEVCVFLKGAGWTIHK